MPTRKVKGKAKTKSKAGSKKQQKKKLIVASIAVGAAGILGYFGWQYLKRKKQASSNGERDVVLKSSAISPANIDFSTVTNTGDSIAKANTKKQPSTKSRVSNGSDFPLQKGSNGENIRLLQQALIKNYGKSILPKYGADGDFGSETGAALKKLGLPASINESTFNVLVQAVRVDKSTIGKDLFKAVITKDYNKAISTLKKMESTEDYAAASDVFKEGRINGVRQTIVNGLLNTFASDAQKQAMKYEFLRMGLQFDGNKWSLSGIDGLPLVTLESTSVWVNAKESVKVPARMVLGNEVSKRLDYTLFENKGKYFLVNTKSVTYL